MGDDIALVGRTARGKHGANVVSSIPHLHLRTCSDQLTYPGFGSGI